MYWDGAQNCGGTEMLSLQKVKSELETFGYTYDNNILCGHTKSKVKWVLPTGTKWLRTIHGLKIISII